MSALSKIEAYLKKEFDLSVKEKAFNGVQIENNGRVDHIYSAVDFSLELLERVKNKNSLFITHHGFLWGEPLAIAHRYYQMLRIMIENNHCLIAIHLPLDFHEKKGNNVLLAKHLKMKNIRFFGDDGGYKPLLKGNVAPIAYGNFIKKISSDFNPILCALNHGEKTVQTIGLCAGGGLFGLTEAKREGCDTFITGDANHRYHHLSKELCINLLSLGHYNTEVFGIKHLGNELGKVFTIPNTFIDIPTNL